MTDRPILFSAPMVRALLEGRKTQHREIIKPQGSRYWQEFAPCGDLVWRTDVRHKCGQTTMILLPQAGDRLWVRETWAPLSELTHNDPGCYALAWGGFYRADEGTVPGEIGRWRPSIHMPRWASRITLVVTDVRVQRLNDISEEDTFAEGVTRIRDACHVIKGFDYDLAGLCHTSATTPFQKFWDHTNGHGSWEANPFIAAYSFTVHHCNIDAMPRREG